MFAKQTVKDIDLKNKVVLLRADYNVPLKNGKIADDYRIKQSLPTVKYIAEHAKKLIICSHLGRPEGQVDPAVSLKPVAKHLQELLGQKVKFVDDCIGPDVEKAVSELEAGGILMLENVRFHAEEEANDKKFAEQMAGLADAYVNDAFSVDHHPAVSVSGLAHLLPAVAGFLLQDEMNILTEVMEKPKQPLMALIGGAKIADKIDVMNRFLEIADCVAVGGAMANTFLVAQDIEVGASLYDKAEVALAKDILKKAEVISKKRSFVFVIPRDVVVATKIDSAAPTRIVELFNHAMADIQYYPKHVPLNTSNIAANEMILDIGPASAAFISGMLELVNTVVWSGTMGVTETLGLHGAIGPTAYGTQLVVDAILGEHGHKPFSVVGGGDTVAYVQSRNLSDAFDHVSTGGSASLEVLAGHKLPGAEALLDKK